MICAMTQMRQRQRCFDIVIMALTIWFCCGGAIASADSGVGAGTARAQFANDDLGWTHHLAVGLGCVVVISLLGWLTVVLARKFGLSQPQTGSSATIKFHVLASRRITPRLHIAAIQISNECIVVIADNGRAIEKLAELPMPSASGTSK